MSTDDQGTPNYVKFMIHRQEIHRSIVYLQFDCDVTHILKLY